MKEDPRMFDIGKKGFLTYEEYRGYSLGMLKQPLSRKEMGNNIGYDQIRFRRDVMDLAGVFDFFSSGEETISFHTLKKAVSTLKMDIPDTDIMNMIHMFSPNDAISRKLFAEIFG